MHVAKSLQKAKHLVGLIFVPTFSAQIFSPGKVAIKLIDEMLAIAI